MTVLYTYASVQVVLNILTFTVDEHSPTWLVSTARRTALAALAVGRFIYPRGKVYLLATRSCFSDIDMPQAAAFFSPTDHVGVHVSPLQIDLCLCRAMHNSRSKKCGFVWSDSTYTLFELTARL